MKANNKDNSIRGSPASVIQTPTAVIPPIIQEEEAWICPPSEKSLRTTNPIRAIVDPIVASLSGQERNDGKNHISLALGDPTASGHLPTCPVAIDAVINAVKTPGNAAGYINALGKPEARAAIAKHHGAKSPDDVIIANGCSGALELALTALLDPGTVLLVPRPGFPLYQVIAESHGASVAHYNLLPTQNWQCDLKHIVELVDQYPPGAVRGIVVNNPSNPTGSVYSKEHLEDIVNLARSLQVPVIADEVYGDLTFGENEFYPMAQVARGCVPIITASGLAKQYLLPGWRVGWIVFHDSNTGALREVQAGSKRLAQVILGASHLAQSVVPALLDPSEEDRDVIAEWKTQLKSTLALQAQTICNELSECHGLSVHFPKGAMYAMVELDINSFDNEIEDDLDFTKQLLKEENVFVLPGRAFGVDPSQRPVFRVVFCASVDLLREAAQRICEFCARHQKMSENAM
jgi:tyrosine aminotransferase